MKIKKSQNQITDKLLEDKRSRQETVMRSFEYFFPFYFPHYLKYETPDFHKEIFRILENEDIKLAIIIAFRGASKSSLITTAYVLWSILGVQKKKFVIINGRSERETKISIQNIKTELEQNELLKRDLGPFDEEKNSLGNSTALIIRKLNAKIMISSTEQSIRGIRHGEYRPDLFILDDIEDLNSIRTQESRDKLYNWFEGDISPAGDKNTRMIIIGNRLHEDSLLKRLQKKIESGEMKGVYKEYPIIDEQGNPLWPGKYPTQEHIREERSRFSNVAWSREFLLKIVADEDQIIKREWIKRYGELPPVAGNSYHAVSVDLAISQSENADYTAIVSARIYGYGKNLKIFILPHPVNERLSALVTIDRIVAVVRSLGYPTKVFVEDVAYQRSVIEHLKRENIKAIGVKVQGDKASRLWGISQLLEDGKVFFPEKPDKNIELLINQLIGFGTEKHDDLVDAFTMLLSQILERGKHLRPVWLSTEVDDRGLEGLSSREKMVEMEKRQDAADRLKRFLRM